MGGRRAAAGAALAAGGSGRAAAAALVAVLLALAASAASSATPPPPLPPPPSPPPSPSPPSPPPPLFTPSPSLATIPGVRWAHFICPALASAPVNTYPCYYPGDKGPLGPANVTCVQMLYNGSFVRQCVQPPGNGLSAYNWALLQVRAI